MAYKGTWGTFVHIPKTGGTTVRHYLQEHIGKGDEVGQRHELPHDVDNGFAVVRHPVAWLRSLWTYRNNSNWGMPSEAVYNWPAIISLTQWGAGLSWSDWVAKLVEYDVDIVSIVYGMYQHPNVEVYKIEEGAKLVERLGSGFPLRKLNESPNKPDVTVDDWNYLCYLCRRSVKDYGYMGSSLTNYI